MKLYQQWEMKTRRKARFVINDIKFICFCMFMFCFVLTLFTMLLLFCCSCWSFHGLKLLSRNGSILRVKLKTFKQMMFFMEVIHCSIFLQLINSSLLDFESEFSVSFKTSFYWNLISLCSTNFPYFNESSTRNPRSIVSCCWCWCWCWLNSTFTFVFTNFMFCVVWWIQQWKNHSFIHFMVYLFQVLIKSGGTTTVQRGKNALSRKARQVQYSYALCSLLGPHPP